MTLTYVIAQNLRRNPLRSGLTAVAFALPMAIFVVSISLVAALAQMAANNAKELRLAVRNRVTLTNFLPEGMRKRIEALDSEKQRIVAVCGMRWFGGRIEGEANTIPSLAADPDTFPTVYSDIKMTPDEVGAWNRDRRAALIGKSLAAKHNWKVGDRITLTSEIPPYLPLEFMVIKVMQGDGDSELHYFRRDYLMESLRTGEFDMPEGCNLFWVKCTGPAAMSALQTEIDATFANSPDETKSEDENAFLASFVMGTGNIPGLLQAIAIVIVFIIALISGNTSMMSFRERIAELAVFKAIGFQSKRVFVMVLAESVLLAVAGCVLGIALVFAGFAALAASGNGGMVLGPLVNLQFSSLGIGGALLISLVIGLASGAWPAMQAIRIRTVDALRRVG